ncbi:hypothetical protein CRUP_008005 [Coryphaenoides rupestris]|nr:hypothetical protein CRUP_008005 [Coryphaenoides rupestris]
MLCSAHCKDDGHMAQGHVTQVPDDPAHLLQVLIHLVLPGIVCVDLVHALFDAIELLWSGHVARYLEEKLDRSQLPAKDARFPSETTAAVW